MKKKCYLHIGLTKTGSTFLQNTLYNNYELLKASGCLYPIDHTFHYRHQLCETDGGNFLSSYINIIQNSECHSAILSSEPISYLSPETYQELGHIFDLKIVVFLRSLPSWIESEQSENMINTAFWTTDERVSMYPLRKINGHSLLVFQNLLFWQKIFGKENFIFLNYDTSKSNNTLLSDFLRAVDFPDPYKEFIPGTVANKMLCTELLYFLAHTNFLPLHKKTRKFLVDELQKINKLGKFNTQYRLLSEECFGSLYPEMVNAFLYWWKDVESIHEFGTNSFDAVKIANDLLKDDDFYKKGLEAYLRLPEFPYLQLPLNVQKEIFMLLPSGLQQEIEKTLPAKVDCNETPIFLPNIVYDAQLYSLLRKWNNTLSSSVPCKEEKIMKVCKMPFENCLLSSNGEVFPCCAHWTNNFAFGNFFEESFDAIWHSKRAQEFRARILRGDYSLCNNREFCKCYSYDFLVDIDSIDTSPKVKHIDFAHDFECNLACISCRKKMFCNSADTLAALNSRIENFFIPLVKSVDSIRLSGQGDPLFSKHYNLLIQKIANIFPEKFFQLYTNGQYLTHSKLESLGILERVESLNISIDAASSDTYRKIRRGGSFAKLIENINFATNLKCRDQAVPMVFSFVIQLRNYREIPQFVELAEKYNAKANFLYYIDYDCNQGKQNNVANKMHPQFFDFLHILHSPSLADKQDLFSQIYDVIGDEYRLDAWRKSYSNLGSDINLMKTVACEAAANEWKQRAVLLNNSKWVALGRALGIIKLNW